MATALITGASGGIGLELARLFAADGHDLALVARNSAKLHEIAGALRSQYGVTVHAVVADLSQSDAPAAIADALNDTAIEFLVNNAGYGIAGAFAQTDATAELAMIQVNATAVTQLTKLFLQPMIRRGRGKIFNVASIAAFLPGPFMAVYYATKAYIVSFSEALAEELRGSGITVTTLCPGRTATGFADVASIPKTSFVTLIRPMRSVDVATSAYRAMMKAQRVVVTGVINKLLAQCVRLLPRTLLTQLTRRLQGRG